MDNISNILTDEEKSFIKKHNLSPSDFYDARGEITKVYHDKAKALGCRFVINQCQHGHRLKTRSGHCIVCQPANIAFQNRHSSGGVVYVAVSGKYTKVGMIDNKRNSSMKLLAHREYQLNSEGGYAGRTGWTLIKSWKVEKDAGRIEHEAHRLLHKYHAEEYYIYSGEIRDANEVFECSITTAIEAIKKAIELYR